MRRENLVEEPMGLRAGPTSAPVGGRAVCLPEADEPLWRAIC